MRRRAFARSGFTLLEVLVATAMVATLAAALYASLHVAFKARRSAENAVADVRKMNMTADMIKADLSSAVVPNGILAAEFIGLDTSDAGRVSGDGDAVLNFYAVAMDIQPVAGTGDVKKIEYVCRSDAGATQSAGMVLVRRITTNLLAPAMPEPAEEIVCRGVRSVALRYYDGSAWQDTWDSTVQDNVLPTAVEVTIVLEDGSADNVAKPYTSVVLLPCGQGISEDTPS